MRLRRVGWQATIQPLCDVTLVGGCRVAYSYPAAIEDLMLDEHE